MAFVYNPQQKNQQQQQDQQGQSQLLTQAPTTFMGSGQASTTVGGTGGQDRSKQAGSGRFTNIQQYLKANQGQDVSKGIRENIGGEVNKVKEGIQQSYNQFQQGTAADQARYNQAQQLRQQALENSAQFVEDPNKLQEYTKLRTGQLDYTPEQQQQFLQQSAQLGSQAQQAAQMAQQAGSEQGRFGLLQQTYASPTYTRGQQRLDQLLLQTDPNQIRALTQLAAQSQKNIAEASKLPEEAQSRLSALQKLKEEQSSAIAQELGSEAPGERSGALGSFVSDVEERMKQENEARANLTSEIQGYLTSSKNWADLSDEAKQLLLKQSAPKVTGQGQINEPGMEQKLGAVEQVVSSGNEPAIRRFAAEYANDPVVKDLLSGYLRKGSDVTKEQVATQEGLKKYQALNKLAGKEGQFLTEEDVNKANKIDERANLDLKGLQDAEKASFYQEMASPAQNWAQEWDNINKARYGGQGNQDTLRHILKADPRFKEYISKSFGMSPQEVTEAANILSDPRSAVLFAGINPSAKKLLNIARSVGGIGNLNNVTDLMANLAINYVYNDKYAPQFKNISKKYGANENANFHDMTMQMRQLGSIKEADKNLNIYGS